MKERERNDEERKEKETDVNPASGDEERRNDTCAVELRRFVSEWRGRGCTLRSCGGMGEPIAAWDSRRDGNAV